MRLKPLHFQVGGAGREAALGGDPASEAAQPGAGVEGKHSGLLPGAAAPGDETAANGAEIRHIQFEGERYVVLL